MKYLHVLSELLTNFVNETYLSALALLTYTATAHEGERIGESNQGLRQKTYVGRRLTVELLQCLLKNEN